MTVEEAALALVRSGDETEQNYYRSWLGFLLDGWAKPPDTLADYAARRAAR